MGHETEDLIRRLSALPPDISLREFARRSGVSVAQLSKIRSGDQCNPTLDTYRKICEALAEFDDGKPRKPRAPLARKKKVG